MSPFPFIEFTVEYDWAEDKASNNELTKKERDRESASMITNYHHYMCASF